MERPKYRYHLAFQCTKNGHFRANMTYYVSASSEAEAKRLVKEIYPDAKAFRIIGKWENKPKPEYLTRENVAPKVTKTYNAAKKPSDDPYADPEKIICSIWDKRKAEKARLQEQLKAEYSQKLTELISDYDDRRKKLNHELELAEKTVAEEKNRRKTLGLFRFDKRKEANAEITRLKERCEAISGELQELDVSFRGEKTELENEREAERKMLHQRAKEAFPAPKYECCADASSLTIEEGVRACRLMYLLLEMEPGKRYTITDMQSFPELSRCSNSAITSLLRHPVAQSHTVRTIERGIAYYTLTVPKELRE